ncbi:Peptide methionine sulfoxide reductase [Dirofilaria immitis]|nr:Peptide methionine sulfoxide reductase [Dirofilaria immitis]
MANLQKAYLGMQCFWGAESTFAKLNGVLATRVGYAGGTTTSPNYYNIGDHTGEIWRQKVRYICSKTNSLLSGRRLSPEILLNLNNEQVVNSLLATKVNAFLAGYKNFDVLKQLADQYGLDDDVVKLIEGIAITGGDTSACHV